MTQHRTGPREACIVIKDSALRYAKVLRGGKQEANLYIITETDYADKQLIFRAVEG